MHTLKCGRYLNVDLNGGATGFEHERRNSEANALVIEPRWLTTITIQRSAKKYANLAKQDPGRGRQSR